MWQRLHLAHHPRPSARGQCFARFGTVIEGCVVREKMELLEYSLAQRADVEMLGMPILLRARLYGASEEVKELLVRYGATANFDEVE